MIRNIIFDLGNVLISFKPADFLDDHGFHEDYKKIILDDIFRSPVWHQIDNGDLTTEEAIEIIASRSSLKRQEISEIFNLRTQILFPLERNIKMLPELKKRGLRLFFLSNFPSDIFDDIVKANPFFCFFDGGLISARAKASKPARRFFEILLEKYNLDPEECLFIDDLEANVQTAAELGMKTIWLYDSLDLGFLIKEKLET